MMAVVTIDHATYKKVKHFNRQELSEFCQEIYALGVKESKEGADDVEPDDVYKVIASVRGIGPKRLAAIKEAVDTAFKENTK